MDDMSDVCKNCTADVFNVGYIVDNNDVSVGLT